MFMVVLLITLVLCSASQSLWLDEVFSLNLINHSWTEMIELAKADVHPPLYYIILKIFICVGGIWTDNTIFLAKLCSCIPFFLCFFLWGKKIRKNYGKLVACLFGVFLVGMPNVLDYAVEIRGYAWGMFFVLGTYLTGEEINSDNKCGKNWGLFTLYAVLAAYIHYFACVAVGVIYVGLLIHNFRKNRFVIKWMVSVLGAIVMYLPWLFVFFSQLKTVIGDYWIEEITLQSIYGYFRFLFAPRVDTLHLDVICGTLIAASYFVLWILSYKEKERRNSNWGLWGNMVLLLMVLLGVAVSLLMRPIFISRYMVIAFGCFWFCYAWMLGENRKKKKLVIFSLVLSSVICIIDFGQFVRWEYKKNEYYKETSKVIKQIDSNDIVFAEGEHIQGCLAYYLGGREILPLEGPEEIFEIPELSEGIVVWCFDKGKQGNILLEKNIDKKLYVEDLGQYHLEYDTFSVVKIFCKEDS